MKLEQQLKLERKTSSVRCANINIKVSILNSMDVNMYGGESAVVYAFMVNVME